MRTLALIPARAGSRGIPHKNTREFRGLPLLAHAIKVGQETCDRTLVSTDDKDAALIAASYHCPVLQRPAELARDDTPMLAVVQHALESMTGFDVIVLLQPSSPTVRRAEYVREARLALMQTGADSVASVSAIPEHFSPDAALWIEDGWLGPYRRSPYGMDELPTRRQQCIPGYHRDGTVYVVKRQTIECGEFYGHSAPLIIPASDSVTLDTEADWALGEAKHG